MSAGRLAELTGPFSSRLSWLFEKCAGAPRFDGEFPSDRSFFLYSRRIANDQIVTHRCQREGLALPYLREWTRLNQIRSVGSILTAGIYLIATITLINSEQV